MRNFLFERFFIIFLIVPFQNLWAVSVEDVEVSPVKHRQIKRIKVKSVSDLKQLVPYESIVVIQKRYLPKTFRGEFNVSISGIINNTFYHLAGLSSRIGFFIREDHGLGMEIMAILPSIDKHVTREIIGPPNNILPYNVTLSQFYAGAYYKWSPIFGKFSFLNKKIIYFDMYLTVGGGVSRVIPGLSENDKKILKDPSETLELTKSLYPTGTLSLGQVFAFSQNLAFNWELKWFYTFINFQSTENYFNKTDIGLSVGMNYYFPGAGYR